MRPVVDGLEKEYAGTVTFRDMNTSKSTPEIEKLAAEFGIQYVPTFVFVNSDGTRSGFVVGEVPADRLRAELDKLK